MGKPLIPRHPRSRRLERCWRRFRPRPLAVFDRKLRAGPRFAAAVAAGEKAQEPGRTRGYPSGRWP